MSNEFIGKEIEVGFSVEDTRGTAESDTSKWLKNVSANIITKVVKVVDNNSQGRIEDSSGQRVVQKWLEGVIEGIVHVDAIGYLFNQLYGAVTTSDLGSSVYSHVFTVNNSIENDTISIFIKEGSVSQKVLNGGVVSSLELNADVGDYLRFNTSIVAKEEAANSNSPSYDTEYDFIAKDITIVTADTEVGLATGTTLNAKNMRIKWDLGAIRDHVFGSYAPNGIYNGNCSIEGNFEKNYNDDTFKDLLNSDSYKYMQITIEGSAIIGGVLKPSITILLNRVQVTNWDRSGGNPDLVTESVDFKAFFSNADAQQSKVTVQNLTQNYDAPY